MLSTPLSERDRRPLELVGAYCEVHWATSNRLAKRQCDKCVYVVRGTNNDMVCLELIYDAIEGEHRKDHIYWVPITAIQYLRVLSEAAAARRIETLEREVLEEHPRD